MAEQTQSDELLVFFKALADPSRLKLVGLLAQQSYTVEQLAAMLNLGVILSRFHEDTAQLRRGMVAHQLMAREGGGGKYWRLEQSV